MVRWHHGLNGHGFVWTLGVGDGHGGLACCGSWGRKKLDTTERLNLKLRPYPVRLLSSSYRHINVPCFLSLLYTKYHGCKATLHWNSDYEE